MKASCEACLWRLPRAPKLQPGLLAPPGALGAPGGCPRPRRPGAAAARRPCGTHTCMSGTGGGCSSQAGGPGSAMPHSGNRIELPDLATQPNSMRGHSAETSSTACWRAPTHQGPQQPWLAGAAAWRQQQQARSEAAYYVLAPRMGQACLTAAAGASLAACSTWGHSPPLDQSGTSEARVDQAVLRAMALVAGPLRGPHSQLQCRLPQLFDGPPLNKRSFPGWDVCSHACNAGSLDRRLAVPGIKLSRSWRAWACSRAGCPRVRAGRAGRATACSLNFG